MDLALPMPNVVCRCGQVLFSWDAVQRHFERHQAEQASLAAYHGLFDEIYRRKGAL